MNRGSCRLFMLGNSTRVAGVVTQLLHGVPCVGGFRAHRSSETRERSALCCVVPSQCCRPLAVAHLHRTASTFVVVLQA